MPLRNRVFIGRVPPVEPDLAQRLERDYGNVSRMHAEISVRDAIVSMRDLGSLNGTSINDMPIVPHQDVRVNLGDRIRFAGTLEATIGLAEPGGGGA
jgi:pSer/pThr/pTyr-binding forkhead associated (FHA) protein